MLMGCWELLAAGRRAAVSFVILPTPERAPAAGTPPWPGSPFTSSISRSGEDM